MCVHVIVFVAACDCALPPPPPPRLALHLQAAHSQLLLAAGVRARSESGCMDSTAEVQHSRAGSWDHSPVKASDPAQAAATVSDPAQAAVTASDPARAAATASDPACKPLLLTLRVVAPEPGDDATAAAATAAREHERLQQQLLQLVADNAAATAAHEREQQRALQLMADNADLRITCAQEGVAGARASQQLGACQQELQGLRRQLEDRQQELLELRWQHDDLATWHHKLLQERAAAAAGVSSAGAAEAGAARGAAAVAGVEAGVGAGVGAARVEACAVDGGSESEARAEAARAQAALARLQGWVRDLSAGALCVCMRVLGYSMVPASPSPSPSLTLLLTLTLTP